MCLGRLFVRALPCVAQECAIKMLVEDYIQYIITSMPAAPAVVVVLVELAVAEVVGAVAVVVLVEALPFPAPFPLKLPPPKLVFMTVGRNPVPSPAM